jgi:hypothetical protein
MRGVLPNKLFLSYDVLTFFLTAVDETDIKDRRVGLLGARTSAGRGLLRVPSRVRRRRGATTTTAAVCDLATCKKFNK